MRPLVTVLALAVLPAVVSAQTTPRPIPRELAGYRLGASRSALPPGMPCEPGQASEMCEVSNFVRVRLTRDTITAIIRSDTGSAANIFRPNDVWRTIAMPMVLPLLGQPDSVRQRDEVTTTGFWNAGGRRVLLVDARFVQYDNPRLNGYVIVRSVFCLLRTGTIAQCLQGDRP